MKIQYDTPIYIQSMHVYGLVMLRFHGLVAGRIDEDNKCWIKLWSMQSRDRLERFLKANLK